MNYRVLKVTFDTRMLKGTRLCHEVGIREKFEVRHHFHVFKKQLIQRESLHPDLALCCAVLDASP